MNRTSARLDKLAATFYGHLPRAQDTRQRMRDHIRTLTSGERRKLLARLTLKRDLKCEPSPDEISQFIAARAAAHAQPKETQ